MLPKIVVPAIAAIVGVGIGYGWAMKGSVGAPGAAQKDMTACYEDATKKLMDAGIIMPDNEVRSITGTVQAISGNTVTLAVPSLNRNPLSEPTPTTRTITIADGTMVTLRKERNMDEFMKEVDAYQKAMFERSESQTGPEGAASAPAKEIAPPQQYTETTITLSDIKVGMRVTVSAEADILRAEQITATSFSVIERAMEDADSLPPGAAPEMQGPSDDESTPPSMPTAPRAIPPGGI